MTAAGIVENYAAHEYPSKKIQKLMDINVMGTWYCSLEAANLMPNGGSIIMIGSMSGHVSCSPPSAFADITCLIQIVNVPQPQTPYNMSSTYRYGSSRLGCD